MEKKRKKRRNEKNKAGKNQKREYYGKGLSVALVFSFLGIFWFLWALFISGPSRIHEQLVQDRIAVIEEQVPDIQGLEENTFEFITYQGYTADTLYWFDMTGQIITTRQIGTLDYNKAKETASSQYGMETETIQLAYGYTTPVYEIQGSGRLLLLDYDTLQKVYERETDL